MPVGLSGLQDSYTENSYVNIAIIPIVLLTEDTTVVSNHGRGYGRETHFLYAQRHTFRPRSHLFYLPVVKKKGRSSQERSNRRGKTMGIVVAAAGKRYYHCYTNHRQ